MSTQTMSEMEISFWTNLMVSYGKHGYFTAASGKRLADVGRGIIPSCLHSYVFTFPLSDSNLHLLSYLLNK